MTAEGRNSVNRYRVDKNFNLQQILFAGINGHYEKKELLWEQGIYNRCILRDRTILCPDVCREWI